MDETEEIMRISKNMDHEYIGKRMLLSAIKIEESLAELLCVEIKILRKQIGIGGSYDEYKNVNKIIKYLIFSLSIVDDRIQERMDYEIRTRNKDEN